MKRVLFGLLWLAAMVWAGAGLAQAFLPHVLGRRAVVGALVGAQVFFPLAGFGLLPGAAARRGTAPAWGWRQAVWMVVQFFTMQTAAQVFLVVVFAVTRVVAKREGWAVPKLDLSKGLAGFGDFLVWAAVAGYLAAAWWSVWYIGRLGAERWRDGGPAGIGWRPAARRGYVAAVGCLVVVGGASALVQRVFPQPADATNVFVAIFGGSAWKIGVLFVLAAVVAPFLEELVFRGGMMAALSPRLGVVWAAGVTSVVFTLCHFEEFWSYHAGLLVIACVAVALAWLRVRYGSIRPGILLHVLFNGFGVLALVFAR